MTHLQPADFIRFLNQIYPSPVPFTLSITHKKTEIRGGSYRPSDQHIRIYDHWGGDDLCKGVAIHEYAHHLHFTMFKRDENQEFDKVHGKHFWQIYGALISIAHIKGLYTSEYLRPLLDKTL